MKKNYVANTWFKKKITYRSEGNRTDIDFLLVGRNDRTYLKDVKAISGYLQHALVVADINKRKLKSNRTNNKVVRKVWKLIDKDVQSNFKQRVGELIKAPHLWKSFQDSILKACDEICGEKLIRKNRGGTWWWNEEVQNVIARKKKNLKHHATTDQKRIGPDTMSSQKKQRE